MQSIDIEKIEAEALPKLTKALNLFRNGKPSGRTMYRNTLVATLTKSYRLGAAIAYQDISKNEGLTVSRVKANDKQIKRRARLLTNQGFAMYKYDLLFLLYDIAYKMTDNPDVRKDALVDDWIVRLPQILATECQMMMNSGATATAMTARVK